MKAEHQKIIQEVADEVKQKLEGEGSGHDWWHIIRVWNMAKHIGISEGADMFVVELAALLHDIADWKFHDGDDTVGLKMARQILENYSVPAEIINHVCDIIASMFFKGAGITTEMKTLEGKLFKIPTVLTLSELSVLGVLLHTAGTKTVRCTTRTKSPVCINRSKNILKAKVQP